MNNPKVAVILLTHNRLDSLRQVIEQSLPKAGCDFDLFIVDNGSTDDITRAYISSLQTAYRIMLPNNTGVANGLNTGLKMAYDMGYEFFQLCANDILEPENWIKMKLEYLKQYPAGMISIAPQGKLETTDQIITPRYCHVIGQFMLTKEVIDKVGFFSTRYSKLYHPMDCDYNTRCNNLGFKNYYISNMSSQHFGNHGGENSVNEYGYLKNDHLATTWQEYIRFKDNEYANKDNCKIPYEPYIIYENQYFGESKS